MRACCPSNSLASCTGGSAALHGRPKQASTSVNTTHPCLMFAPGSHQLSHLLQACRRFPQCFLSGDATGVLPARRCNFTRCLAKMVAMVFLKLQTAMYSIRQPVSNTPRLPRKSRLCSSSSCTTALEYHLHRFHDPARHPIGTGYTMPMGSSSTLHAVILTALHQHEHLSHPLLWQVLNTPGRLRHRPMLLNDGWTLARHPPASPRARRGRRSRAASC